MRSDCAGTITPGVLVSGPGNLTFPSSPASPSLDYAGKAVAGGQPSATSKGGPGRKCAAPVSTGHSAPWILRPVPIHVESAVPPLIRATRMEAACPDGDLRSRACWRLCWP